MHARTKSVHEHFLNLFFNRFYLNILARIHRTPSRSMSLTGYLLIQIANHACYTIYVTAIHTTKIEDHDQGRDR